MRQTHQRYSALVVVIFLVLNGFPSTSWALYQQQFATHVRVILDTSKSMEGYAGKLANDPGRMAILSAILLHDLVKPNISMGDTFELLPFDDSWTWPQKQDAPPLSKAPFISVSNNGRTQWVREVKGLRYNGKQTLFYPVLKRAVESLSPTKHPKSKDISDIRVVVFITDGQPDVTPSFWREEDKQWIRTKLIPEMEKNNIKLYFLAFGQEVFNNTKYFEEILQGSGNPGMPAKVGGLFAAKDGLTLLEHMVEIFNTSFGYISTIDDIKGSNMSVDLRGKEAQPERVAVVVHQTGTAAQYSKSPPLIELQPPKGSVVHNPDGILDASESGGSYALGWFNSPAPGGHNLTTNLKGKVAVLRPSRMTISIKPFPPSSNTSQTMAVKDFKLKVLVQTVGNNPGDPGPDIQLSFRIGGSKSTKEKWWDRWTAPLTSTGQVDGRVFDIQLNFIPNPENQKQKYIGHLEAQATRNSVVVGSMINPHPVDVFPLVGIKTDPQSALIGNKDLDAHESACVDFKFQVTGQLDALPVYPIKAYLISPKLAGNLDPLKGTFLTLDGSPLQFIDSQGILILPNGQPQSEWSTGKKLDLSAFSGNHTLCVKMGKPQIGSGQSPLIVPLYFKLMTSPYDDFDVITPMELKISVAQPSMLDRYLWPVLTSLLFLLLLATLWYTRRRPSLPEDLEYAIVQGMEEAALTQCAFNDAPLLSRLLGLKLSVPIIAPGSNRLLAWICPDDLVLFNIQPGPGVEILPHAEDQRLTLVKNVAQVAIYQLFILRIGENSYLTRLTYRS